MNNARFCEDKFLFQFIILKRELLTESIKLTGVNFEFFS
jgi:hypothetical protein